ncbi:phosphoribosyl-AMP cyclohydrolase [Leptospira gomenensis]|uniref:phosphoribosyl-AMP cyclohydrolase n=1 Tax=Leptospira gomenensis TaxID=2484974 RepID=A0A5F1YBN0_9LEPT|nr:phosphoribosyl-AMP cyclohydrolase [Leptospira gomenensis]TGK33765.1 phosphoribosyl-AMP cyclohydrolase [Leptospira gomenensis]TGK40767.1 phosphoribosyl-AMP cyclohydrolase [Leptospira gomenensis]TGK40956.1 phosphoribosyl-AMP cyclohydrolase [Leptospira gomenensis]TGK55752.1 phosphoribosyl-AMP cyclohydrolase [Leptospira gomenensis]
MNVRKLTILQLRDSDRAISSLTRIFETELTRYRIALPRGFREEVDCDEDTILFLHTTFAPLEMAEVRELLPPSEDGMIPVVTIDENGQILMQAFGNSESQRLSLETGFAHYYSRSRDQLWKKGETSGHTQKILRILAPFDRRFLVYQVVQEVAACHEGYYSCFFRERIPGGTWKQLPIPRNFLPEKN